MEQLEIGIRPEEAKMATGRCVWKFISMNQYTLAERPSDRFAYKLCENCDGSEKMAEELKCPVRFGEDYFSK